MEFFFDRDSIIDRLVKLRVKRAKKRHDQHFLYNLNTAYRNPSRAQASRDGDADIDMLLPPRRKWKRPTKYQRERLTAKAIAQRSILSAISRASSVEPRPEWFNRLEEFVSGVRRRLTPYRSLQFDKPRIVLIQKDARKKTFRPLATFNLADQVFIGLAANHLRATIDSELSEHAYAFRTGSRDNPPPTHHDAVNALREYIVSHHNILYVAECDIQKFFDTVSHEVARKQLQALLRSVRESGRFFDKRLLKIFDAYLRAYNFPNSVDAKSQELLSAIGVIGGSVPWAKDSLKKYYSNGVITDIGVPQGGALSPIIANIVLHAADEAVVAKANELGASDYFYARYCDDMILASPSREIAEALYSAYLHALERLKLPFHAPKTITRFSRDFFECKSKEVYSFGSRQLNATAPWIAFLGYHVRYDGRLRIRKESLTKEIKKQMKICARVKNAILLKSTPMRARPKQALHRARLHLFAMSVGNANVVNYGQNHLHEMCWVVGFSLLKKYPHVASQLKSLDRTRQRELASLKKALSKIKGQKGTLKAKSQKALRYYGRPYSYSAQFCSIEKRCAATSSD